MRVTFLQALSTAHLEHCASHAEDDLRSAAENIANHFAESPECGRVVEHIRAIAELAEGCVMYARTLLPMPDALPPGEELDKNYAEFLALTRADIADIVAQDKLPD